MENDIELVEFYKLVLQEYYNSKQKVSIHNKFEDFCLRFKAKLHEIQADLEDLGEDEIEEDDVSEIDSLEAFAAMEEGDDPTTESRDLDKEDCQDSMEIQEKARNLIKQDYIRDLQSNWNKIKLDEQFYSKYYYRILEGSESSLKDVNLDNSPKELLDTLNTLKEDVNELGIQSPLLIGQEMKILQVFGLYDKMWELYRNSSVVSLDGYHAILEYYLTLQVGQPQYESKDMKYDLLNSIPASRPTTITKRKIWQVVTALKSNYKPTMKTYCLLLDLFSIFYQDKKTCVDIMNKMSASGLDYNRECILSGVLAMARCDIDPSPRLDKLLYKYNDTLKLELGRDEEMIKALLKYWVIRKKPHACFKIFQKAVKCQTKLDIHGIEQLLEAAKMTEDPYHVVTDIVVPYLNSIYNPSTTSSSPSPHQIDQIWIAVIKFFSEILFQNSNSYDKATTGERTSLENDAAQKILDISKNISELPQQAEEIIIYCEGVLKLDSGSGKENLKAFMN